MRTQLHIMISVDGLLKRSNAELRGLFGEPGKKVRDYLLEKASKGYKVIPMNGVECEGFDKVKGCPGHVLDDNNGVEYFNPS